MAKVTLDITGMYFSSTVDVPPGASVKDVMTAVQTATAGSATAEFTFSGAVGGSGHEFVEEIAVHHKVPPASRQNPARTYPPGIYKWSDKFVPGTNPVLVWQYYITRKGLSLSGGFGSTRVIVPYSKSNVGVPAEPGVEFEDGDVITWRLVGIFINPTEEVSVKFTAK